MPTFATEGDARQFPSRTAWLLLAAVVALFAIYGSLIPFTLRMRPLSAAWTDFLRHMLNPPRRIPRPDFLANILLFVPLGFGLTGGLLLHRSRWLVVPATLAVLVISVGVSVLAEFLQVFAPGRVSSPYDVIAQTIGSLIGIVAWFVAGPALTAWLRAAAHTSRTDRLARLATAYVAAWIFVSLAPFNFTFDPGELARRVRTGRVTLVPFAAYDGLSARLLWDVVVTTISAMPLGVFGRIGWTQRSYPHTALTACFIGAALVAAAEAAQIFVRAHSADGGDVLFGWLGVAAGVAISARFLPRHEPLPGTLTVRPGRLWAFAALAAWTGMLCAYHWLPYDFDADPAAVRERIDAVRFVPFAAYHSGSSINAFNNLLTTLGLALPVGLLSAFVVPRRAGAGVLVLWTLGVTGLFAVVEAAQLLLPTRVTDPTDVLVGVCGSTVGLFVGHWLVAAPGLRDGRGSDPPVRDHGDS